VIGASGNSSLCDYSTGRYVWDKRDGHYFIEWWEGKRRRRELAGQTPSQATEAQRRNETNSLANK